MNEESKPPKTTSQARTHEENRLWVCLVCWGKIKEKAGQRKVPDCQTVSDSSPDLQKKIAKYIYLDYYKNKDFLPKAVCNGCRRNVVSQGTENARKIGELPLYDNLVEQVKGIPMKLRKSSKCAVDCPICSVGAFHPVLSKVKAESSGVEFKAPEKVQKRKRGRPKQGSPKSAPPNFFDTFNKSEKFEYLVNNLTPYSKEHLAAHVIDAKIKELKETKKPGKTKP